MSNLTLDDIDIVQQDEYPVTESVKLNGPPGTGKTTQCAARVAEYIKTVDDATVGDITWVTYRKSLALDTINRLIEWGVLPENERRKLLRGQTKYINTIHAVANRTIGGIGDVVKPYHKADFSEDKLGLDFWTEDREPWEDSPGQLWFDLYGYVKTNCLDWDTARQTQAYTEFVEEAGTHPSLQVMDEMWEDYKQEREIHDYWEMLKYAFESTTYPNLDLVVIDEYHDAYPLMDKLSRKWIDAADTAIIAGDPLQVVNAYRGADPGFFLDLDLPEILLPRSYRLPIEHWDYAKDVLTNAHEKPDIEITDKPGTIKEHFPVQFRYNESTSKWQYPNGEGSPQWFVENFGEDILFLTRTRKQANGIASALRQEGIIYRSQEGADGWNRNDNERQRIRVPIYNALQKMSGVSVEQFGGHGLGSYTGGGDEVEGIVLSSDEAAAMLDHAGAKYLTFPRSDAEDKANEIRRDDIPVRLSEFDEFVKPTFWTTYTQGPGAVRHLVRNVDDRFKETLRMALRYNDEPITPKQIQTRVLTIHASKGAEAETVVLYDGTTGKIESEMRHNPDIRENEYRTWYVGLTRSESNLFIIRDGFEWTNPFLPSRGG